jgi:heat shock protein HslJ
MTKKLILPMVAAAILAGAMFFVGCEKATDNNKSKNPIENYSAIEEDNSITNVRWHLTKFVDDVNHKETAPVPADNTHYFWMELCNDTIQGYGQVNEMFGSYTISGSKIHIYDLAFSKVNPIDDSEHDFFSAIEKADSFKTDGKILHVYYDGDKKNLKFEKINGQ